MNKGKQWRFLKRDAISKSLQPTQELKPLKLYQNIHKLPLSRYRDCICDNNLYALVIEGTPTPEELTECWENIKAQVAEVSGNNSHSFIKSLYKEVIELQLRYNDIISTIEQLRLLQTHFINRSYDVPQYLFDKQKDLAKKLNKEVNSSFAFNIFDEEKTYRELDGCVTRAGSLKIKLDLRTMAYEAERKKITSDKGEKLTHEYFDKVLINISDYAKYEIHEDITVAVFYERVRRYTDYCKTLKQK